MMGFEILQGGLFTTVQDLGRFGTMHLGITQSGVMDEYAYRWSQKLLNNQNCNALEFMSGLKLKSTSSTQIALCGADMDFKLNGISQPIWQTLSIQVGDILSFDKRVSGQRAYLAVKGGFRVAKKYDSYSTTLRENIGTKLKKGDFLPFNFYDSNHTILKVKSAYIPDYQKSLTLRILLSYQEEYFSQQEKEKFFTSNYEVTLQSDRMGYKLKGRSIIPTQSGIISEAIAYGSVQIPKDGQPIVLLKERQTIGGYPKMGTVLPIDCFKLAQLSIGSYVKFEVIGIAEAQEKMIEFYKN